MNRHQYLLVPMMPTPNGPLHLGHIAGPYLKMDVLARTLRQAGHQVLMITSVDCFETHVIQSAERMGLTVEETSAHYHQAIRNDFAFFRIDFDSFADPFSAEWRASFMAAHMEVAEALARTGALEACDEPFLKGSVSGEPLLGYRLCGNCSNCGSETVGFVCEACGLQMTTETMHRPRAVDGEAATLASGKTLRLSPGRQEDADRAIDAMRVPPEFRASMTAFLRGGNPLRVSTLGTHGVGYFGMQGERYMLYNSYFGHAWFCGEVARQLLDSARNPFDQDSEVVTVTSCGLDNATDLIICHEFARAQRRKSFDHCLGNFFLTLDGRKFSTGARHAIFVKDVSSRGRVEADALRFYLTDISPVAAMRDFDVVAFVALHNGWMREVMLARLNDARRQAGIANLDLPAVASDSPLVACLEQRQAATSLDQFAPADVCGCIRRYLDALGNGGSGPGLDLAGFAVLAWPLMPTLAERIWTDLGLPGMPGLEALRQPQTVLPVDSQPLSWRPISKDDLRW